ncbi:cysteine desulfurase-like protein [Marinobacterium arenosum]|uniref:cysteine desulfurase-like protein n=1 Tax=Marinobacterium arenosum TaxID=2862496 RepID=UPI001C95CD53|nr:cysteine desulfurase-like protein [Marinobacterium arenosum]MBY4676971.1 cysteine desulfurase-like protein [Marinobacterium arenosum]
MSVFDLDKIRARFPALQQQVDGSTPLFLDGPGGSQVSQEVLEAMVGYLGRYNANLGGAYFSSHRTVELMAQARQAAADLYNAASSDEIVFGPNATTLTFTMSRAISRDWQPGDEIIVTALDHYSNVSPWVLAAQEKGATVHQVRVNEDDCTLDYDHLAGLLNSNTKLVAVTYASNTTGSVVDMARVIELVKASSDALTYVDAVHYTPHNAVDVQAMGCDLLVSSAYKYFGPHLGVLYGNKAVLAQLKPYKVAPAKDVDPNRWETGTQSFEALAGFIAAVDYLAGLSGLDSSHGRRERLVAGYQKIAEHEQQLSALFLDKLQQYPNIKLFGIAAADRLHERTPTFAFRIDGIEPRAVSEFFGKQHVCIWDGNFYAQGLYEQLGLTEVGGVVRVGCMHYNTTEELLRFFRILDQLLA